MRKNVTSLVFLFILVLIGQNLSAQALKPVVQFTDEPRTHNAHLASDGKFLYTINGGKAYLGAINKYTLNGEFVTTYDIDLDMRSIMYDQKNEKFYVCTYDRNIYLITDMERGKYELVLSELYENEQANLAMSPNGKLIYYFDRGAVTTYKFPSGKFVRKIYDLDCGKDFTTGSCSVAVNDKYIYTWNSEERVIYEYSKTGKKIRTIRITQGDYGFSLSIANGMIWTAIDGNYSVGKWFGYNIWEEKK